MLRWLASLRSPRRPDGVPEERWVVLDGAEGIIFPADSGRTYHSSDVFVATWTPSREVVLLAESRVAAYFRSYPALTPETAGSEWRRRYSAPLILAKLGKYQRQYWGIQFDGRPALFMNFFPRRFSDRWATQCVDVEDGGHDFFRLVYRPEDNDFPLFDVNGEA